MKEIECPICHGKALIWYNEDRIYQSTCQNKKCQEVVTLTTKSWVDAVDLFSQFGKGRWLAQIPRHLAENLDHYNISIQTEEDFSEFMFEVYETYETDFFATYEAVQLYLNPLSAHLVKIVDTEEDENE